MFTELIKKASELALQPVRVDRRGGCRLLRVLEQCDRRLHDECRQLLAAAAAGRQLAPEEAWLLDNYSYIHAQLREVREAVPRVYYRGLPRLTAGPCAGDPHVYLLAREIVSACPACPLDTVRAFLETYQSLSPLTLAELWAILPFLKLAIVEQVCAIFSAGPRDAACEAAVRDLITGLRALELTPWRDFVESICLVDRVLRCDPAGVYARMDFDTRDGYRHAIEGMARRSRLSEIRVAELAIDLAQAAARGNGCDWREAHVGYYLIGPGQQRLKEAAGYRGTARGALRQALFRHSRVIYLGGVLLLTAALLAVVARVLAPLPWWYLALLAVPVSQAALAIMNPLVHLAVPPRGLPRLDFSEGIPDDCRAFVVVPTLLLSRAGVEKLLERLEIHYLANRDPNLLFGLLTDFPDSSTPTGPRDSLLQECVESIRRLNLRHAGGEHGPFYLFHRARRWDEREGVWMGRERKRGKLEDFNALLLGEGDAFQTKVGDLSVLRGVRYVITLDSDTQLPRDTARKLIATMAHPLNRPVFDPAGNMVVDGYAILQPRVSISMESAGRSRLARLYSGQTGFDPYTTAVSDVYQDLHGQASFTGKGIYDVEAFHRALHGRFPENAILSHDLIEGEHARVGLATDLELIDDYPSTWQAYCKRKHRWVRGDWQIAPWLLRRVPHGSGRRVPNSLSALSRWKIFDNLRRSLLEPSLFLLLLCGWFCLPAASPRFTAAAALLVFPVYTDLVLALLRLPPPRFWRSYLRECVFRFARGHLDAMLNLAFLPSQACLMADAVVRTVIRRWITHRRLLEWESMAQSETSVGRGVSLPDLYLHLTPALALAVTFALLRSSWPPPHGIVMLVLNLWIVSPLIALWLNGRGVSERRASTDDTAFLRQVALRTWRYFTDFGGPEDNWLAPDNVQEEPAAVARRTSPSNLGLQLAAHVAALDFGYVTPQEFTMRLDRMLQTMHHLERHRGHFYNWYDIRTLLPLYPHYISTVDSGNLAASLMVLKQGCLDLLRRPMIEQAALCGLRDHCLRLRDCLPGAARTAPVMRLIDSLLRQLEYRPTDLFFWEGVLTESHAIARRLCEHLDWLCGDAGEAHYWSRTLCARIETTIGDLCALAPWLSYPFEPELRPCSSNGSLAELMSELCRTPAIAELPARYRAIQGAIRRRLAAAEPLHACTRETLEALLPELEAARGNAARLIRDLEGQAEVASAFVRDMDFIFLFDRRRKLLRIGYDAAAGCLDPAYYDLLASEARTAVFVAIAKGDLPREAWFHLGRKLTSYRGHHTLLSWSGTMFEYLMPSLFMNTYEHTLLGASLHSVVRIQQLYCGERRVPWGISEAAFSARDSNLHYQYYAFGVPLLGLKRRAPDDLVIAPYAAMLALMVDRPAATSNLRHMAAKGWLGAYGFFDSADYSAQRTSGHRFELVRAFMAHHQGMSLLALSNTVLDGAVQNRFHAEPMVLATAYLLQERVPALLAGPEEEERLDPELPHSRPQIMSMVR